MATAEEALEARTPIGADLAEGVKALSLDQKITFTKYVRLVLPLDGYVFWVRGDSVSRGALLNASRLNQATLNEGANVTADARTLVAMGSLHYATDQRQDQEATYAVNRVVFTSLQEVQDFNQIGPNLLFIAEFDGIRFAFSSRGSFYKQTQLYHYVGQAIFATMESQIIDDPRELNTRALIVSNSLPAWLALNQFDPTWPVPLPLPAIQLFPSFLSPSNTPPPYGTIHIDPNETQSLSMAPAFGSRLSQQQPTRDLVTVTLWGANNDVALTFASAVMQYMLDTEVMGLMDTPTPRDDHITQNELNVLAQKKRIIFEVSYLQGQMRDIARQLILTCVPEYIPQEHPLPPCQEIQS